MTDVGFRYGRREVLHRVSASLGPGVHGLLGPNGAGKSTLLNLLATFRRPSTGRIEIAGTDVATRAGRAAARRDLGVLTQRYPLVGSMRVIDIVTYAAWAQGLTEAEAPAAARHALTRVGLADLHRIRVRHLSGGQRQRVGIASAIAHGPRLLLLDEPTAGLDPAVRIEFRRTITEVATVCTVLMSTHMIEDVARLCPHVLVLSAGRVAFDGTRTQLAALGTVASTDDMGSPLEKGYEVLLSADVGEQGAWADVGERDAGTDVGEPGAGGWVGRRGRGSGGTVPS